MKNYILKLWIYFLGIRFQETKLTPGSVEIIKSEFKTVKNHKINFLFFKEIHKDIVYKQGSFFSSKSESFVIQAQFDNQLSDNIVKFNYTKYFFRDKCFNWFSDQETADILLSIYLEFIKSQLE